MTAYLKEFPPMVPPPSDLPFFDVRRIAATLAALDEELLEMARECGRLQVLVERLRGRLGQSSG